MNNYKERFFPCCGTCDYLIYLKESYGIGHDNRPACGIGDSSKEILLSSICNQYKEDEYYQKGNISFTHKVVPIDEPGTE